MRGVAGERESGGRGNFGMAWFLLCLAFCAHVADEALTGFLPIYNATVLAMRSQYKWFPMPTFEFREWLAGLITANIVLLLLTPFAFRNAWWLRPLAYFHAVPFRRFTSRGPRPASTRPRCFSRVRSIFWFVCTPAAEAKARQPLPERVKRRFEGGLCDEIVLLTFS